MGREDGGWMRARGAGGVSGGLAGALINGTSEHSTQPRRVADAGLFMMLRVNRPGPSRNLINEGSLPIKISAQAHSGRVRPAWPKRAANHLRCAIRACGRRA